VKIKNAEIIKDIVGGIGGFPKYTTQLINLANQNSGGTRPRVVGKMTDLIQEFQGRSFLEWVEWYQQRKPEAVENATDKILNMLQNLRSAMALIDEDMVRKWVKDLVLTKTYTGLRFQESILKIISQRKGVSYRLSTPGEEAKGIDGYIGDIPVSIKPNTFKYKTALPESIEFKMIYYEKRKTDIIVECDF
jgi:hypothetical protein